MPVNDNFFNGNRESEEPLGYLLRVTSQFWKLECLEFYETNEGKSLYLRNFYFLSQEWEKVAETWKGLWRFRNSWRVGTLRARARSHISVKFKSINIKYY